MITNEPVYDENNNRTYTYTASRVVYLMKLAVDVVGPSNVSSHAKGELLYLLKSLSEREALRLLELEAKREK